MALVLADRVRETTTTAGTGTITLLGAVPSCQSFAVVGNGNTTYYTIVAYTGTEYEVGIGTYTSSGTTLSRDTVLASSNGGSLVNFSAGTKDVFVDYPAGRAVYEDAAGNVDGYPITGGTINNTTIGATTPSTGVFTTLTAQTEVLKGTGQNLVLYSQTFTNSNWSTGTVTRADNQTTAPDGTTTAGTITSTNQAYGGLLRTYCAVTSTTYTLSAYVKKNNWSYVGLRVASIVGTSDRYAYFNLDTLATSTNGISGATFTATSVGNGWYRIVLTGVNNTTGTFVTDVAIVASDGASATNTGAGNIVYVWGVQLEIGSTANTYIPTTTTAVYGTPTLSFSGVASIGLQSDGSLYETSAGTGNVRFYTNNIGQEQARVSHAASAVNFVQLTGAATGGYARVTAQGSDTNVPLYLASKNSAEVLVAGSQFTSAAPSYLGTNQVNYVVVNGSPTGFGSRVFAAGTDTNIPLVLQPKGTGALQAQQTDSTATGGNARGANAVDWQTLRDTSIKVASGLASVVAGGQANYASSFWGVVSGGYNNANIAFGGALAGGYQNLTAGNYSVSSGGRFNTSGGSAFMVGSVSVGGISNSSLGTYNFIGGGFTNSGTSSSAVTTQSATMNGTTAVTLAASNANIKVGQYISGTSIGDDTYVAAISGTSLTLSKVASGSSTSTLSFYTPHGVVVGGGNNQATGAYSAILGGGDAGTAANRNVASGDWSAVVGGQKNVASSNYSFIGGGGYNTASSSYGAVVCGGGFYGNSPTQFAGNVTSGTSAFIGAGFSNQSGGYGSFIGGGNSNIVNSTYGTVVGGAFGTTRGINGLQVFPACNTPIVGTLGVSQAAMLILGRETTNATATVLCSDSSAASTANQVILPNNSAYYFKGSVIANVTGAANGAAWEFTGAIMRGANAASTVLMGTPAINRVAATAGATAWAIAITADTTNGGLAVTVTGAASTTIRWVCKAETTETTF